MHDVPLLLRSASPTTTCLFTYQYSLHGPRVWNTLPEET